MRSRVFLLLIVTGTLLASCNWQMPETVTVKGSPEVYIPSGDAVFELDFLEDIADDFEGAMVAGDPASGDGSFTAGEKPEGEDGYGPGSDYTLYALLTIATPTFEVDAALPSFDVAYGDTTDEIDVSAAIGPLPPTVWVQSAPGEAWYEPSDPGDPPVDGAIEVRLKATWNGGASEEYLLGDATTFDALPNSGDTPASFDVAPALNGSSPSDPFPPADFTRPSDVVLEYEFGTSTDVASEIASITLRFEIPFALETVGESFLDLTDDDGDNELAMDDDIFGRDPEDPDEDLDDLLDSFRGSSAELVMRLKNNTGFGATLAMVNGAADWETIGGATEELQQEAKQDPSNWVVDLGIEPAESLQQVQLDISAATLDEFIDGVPDVSSGVSQFAPEFLIELPYDSTASPPPQAANQFFIKKGAAFNITEGYLRVQADFDYSFSLEGEE